MKKFLSLILTFLVLLFSTFQVTCYAQNRSYSIDEIKIHASINKAGDIIVSENLTYNFRGDFNGINRSINFHAGKEINNISVNIIKDNVPLNIKSSSNGGNNTLEESNEGSTKKLKIYSKSSNEIKKFNINYTILGAATKYTDASELFWKFYENTSNIDIKNISLEVEFPNTPSLDAKFWGIGPSIGNAERIDENKFLFTLPNLSNGQYIGCRIMFPPEYLSEAKKIVNEPAYDRIFNEQDKNQYTNNSESSNSLQSDYSSESNI